MKFKIQMVLSLGFVLGYGLCMFVKRDNPIPNPKQGNSAFTPITDAANASKTPTAATKTPNDKSVNEIVSLRKETRDNTNAIAFSPIPASLLLRVVSGVFEPGGGLRTQVGKEFGLDASMREKVNASLMKSRRKMFEAMCEQGSVKNVAEGQVINIPPLANSQTIIDDLVADIANDCGTTVAQSLVDIASASPYYLAFGKYKVNVSIEEETEPEMRKLYPYRLRYEYFSGEDSRPFNAQGFPLNETEYMRSFGTILRK